MIYWINGAYGVGKSTVAEQLRAKLPKRTYLMRRRWAMLSGTIIPRNANTALFLRGIRFGGN